MSDFAGRESPIEEVFQMNAARGVDLRRGAEGSRTAERISRFADLHASVTLGFVVGMAAPVSCVVSMKLSTRLKSGPKPAKVGSGAL